MLCKTERICEAGRVKVLWHVNVPDKFTKCAEKFIESCHKMQGIDTSEFRGDRVIRATVVENGDFIVVEVKIGAKSLVREEFCVNFS